MKLHVGCGTVYLKGYCNIDVNGSWARKAPRTLLQAHSTTLDRYYKYLFKQGLKTHLIDKRMDITEPWTIKSNSVTEVVMISVLEHLSKETALFVISEIKRVLKSNGRLLLSVPDLKQTVKTYIETDPEWCMRLIYCHGKNEYSLHRYGYTFKTLIKLLLPEFKQVKATDIITHEYPMIQIEAIKS